MSNFPKLESLITYGASQEYRDYLKYQEDSKALAVLESQKVPEHDFLVSSFQELQALVQKKASLSSAVSQALQAVTQITTEYQVASKAASDSEILNVFYKEALQDLTTQYLEKLSATLTDVYCYVYGNTSKSVHLVLEDYRGKKVIRLNMLNSYKGGVYPEGLDADGGSAMLVLGTVISIYFILSTDMPRVMLFDESLSSLDTDVLHNFLATLKRFSTELQFVFVIIDHAAYRMRDYIDQLYTVEDGIYREVTGDEKEQFFLHSMGASNE